MKLTTMIVYNLPKKDRLLSRKTTERTHVQCKQKYATGLAEYFIKNKHSVSEIKTKILHYKNSLLF